VNRSTVTERRATDVCDDDPGYDVAVTVTSTLRGLVEIWRGDRTWVSGLRSGDVEVDGPAELRRAVPCWFTLSGFASVPRPAQVAAAPTWDQP
jgi:hypothetical protein